MKKFIFSVLFIALMCHTFAQKTRYNLMFTKGQTELNNQQKEELQKITTWIKPEQTVSVFPLTYDSIYDRLYFPKNAKDQAEWIATYAQSIGFEIQNIPSNFPSSYKGLSVTVNITYSNPKLINALADLFPEKPSQFFVIDPNKDTMIIGNEGTKLLFESGSLMSKNKVKIELKEYYSLDDYIKGGLPTTSNGKMIETGGSIYLNATQDDNDKKQVKINPDKGVGVDFTIGKTEPDMEVFIKDLRYTDQVNWILPKKIQSKIRQSWQMTETIYNADGSVSSEEVFRSKEEWEAHLKAQQEAAAKKQKEQEIKTTTQNKMDSKLKIYDLGYINCDRFPNESLAPLMVAADEKTTAEYYLVFTDIRGVMHGQVYNNHVKFGGVPTAREGQLIAVSFIDKQAYYFKCTVKAGKMNVPKVMLEPVEESFLNEQLALLK